MAVLFEAVSEASRATLVRAATDLSVAEWTLTGPNAVIKAVSTEDASRTARFGTGFGYVTQARHLDGLNANQIERDLGLRPNSMDGGLYIFDFARLPTAKETEFRFAADWPDGRPWSQQLEAQFFAEREKLLTSPSRLPITQAYPPGSGRVPQWKLIGPVPLAPFYRQVTPSTPFQA